MFNQSLKKFNQLSKVDRDFLSSAEFLVVLNDLEKKYNVKLALVFIELVIGDLTWTGLNAVFPELDSNALGDISGQLSKLVDKFHQTKNKVVTTVPATHISFSPEDDEEIKQIISSSADSFKIHDYSSLAELIISESGYNLDGDEVIFSRLKNAIISRLKDIRDEMETIEVLKKSRKIGGLEMSDDQAQKIITLIKEKINQGLLALPAEQNIDRSNILFPLKKPFAGGKISLEVKKNNSIGRESEMVTPQKLEENKIAKPDLALLPKIEEEDGLPVIKSPMGDDLMIKPKINNFGQDKKPQAIIPPAPVKIFPSILVAPVLSVKPPEIKPAMEKPIAVPQPQPMTKSTPPPKNIRFGKQLVDGVRVSNVLVGPIEELGTMTLINFRRLGETPSRSTAKIKDKIDLLENDSYGKRLEGVGAWHQSEVNRFYRLLGQESMRQERSIDDIINERLKNNKPTLSIEEFNAVMELNRQLRY